MTQATALLQKTNHRKQKSERAEKIKVLPKHTLLFFSGKSLLIHVLKIGPVRVVVLLGACPRACKWAIRRDRRGLRVRTESQGGGGGKWGQRTPSGPLGTLRCLVSNRSAEGPYLHRPGRCQSAPYVLAADRMIGRPQKVKWRPGNDIKLRGLSLRR